MIGAFVGGSRSTRRTKTSNELPKFSEVILAKKTWMETGEQGCKNVWSERLDKPRGTKTEGGTEVDPAL